MGKLKSVAPRRGLDPRGATNPNHTARIVGAKSDYRKSGKSKAEIFSHGLNTEHGESGSIAVLLRGLRIAQGVGGTLVGLAEFHVHGLLVVRGVHQLAQVADAIF